jgi:hypothetical protein
LRSRAEVPRRAGPSATKTVRVSTGTATPTSTSASATSATVPLRMTIASSTSTTPTLNTATVPLGITIASSTSTNTHTSISSMDKYFDGEVFGKRAVVTDAKEEAIKSILSVRSHQESEKQDNKYDSWKVDNDKIIVREHLRPRCELFTPAGMKGSPATSDLLPMRITIGKFLDSNKTFRIADCWTKKSAAHCKLASPWVGTTAFTKKCTTKELYSHSSLNLLTLPGACCLSMRGCNVANFASPEGRFESLSVPIVWCRYNGASYADIMYSRNNAVLFRRVAVADLCTHDMQSHYVCPATFYSRTL